MPKRWLRRFPQIALCAEFLFLFGPGAMPAAALQTPVSVLLQIDRLAGSSSGASGFSGDNASALLATLAQPESVTVDGVGNLYLADMANNRIRRIDALTGFITTVAGNGQQAYSGDNGAAIDAALDQPQAVLADPHGNLYIADTVNRIVRFVNMQSGIITTVAGTPNLSVFDPTRLGNGGLATAAELDTPVALALDSVGNLYIADAGNNSIREVLASNQIIEAVAGNGTPGYTGDNGPAAAATLDQPSGVGLDAGGNLYIADSNNNVIRKITASSGIITTIAGTGSAGFNGDGSARTTELNFPATLAVDMGGQVYFSDRNNNRIRQLNAAGQVITLAGNGSPGLAGNGNLASASQVNSAGGVALDANGNLYVADSRSNEMRVISGGLGFPASELASSTPTVHTIFLGLNQAATLTAPAVAAGENAQQEFSLGAVASCTADGATANPQGSVCSLSVTFVPAYPGMRPGPLLLTANSAQLAFGLYGVGLGPEAVVTPGVIHTVVPPGSAATGGLPLVAPGQVATDSSGNIYVADPGSNQVIRLNIVSGALTMIAGGGTLAPAQADGGPALDAALEQPTAIALDAAGNLYLAEQGANRVRKVSLATGIITTVAGNGTPGYTGDNGVATAAELRGPTGIAATSAGELFVADTGNNVIREIDAASQIIRTVAGNGAVGYTGDTGYATAATLRGPQGVALGATGRLYIADTGNNAVRSVDPVTGILTTVAGTGAAGFSGDGGSAIAATLSHPAAVAVDAAGNLYVADTGNARIRKVSSATGIIVTIAGSAVVGDAGEGGPATAAALSQPSGVALDALGQIILADQSNDSIRRVSTATAIVNFGAESVGATTPAQTEFLSNIGNQQLAIAQVLAPLDFPLAQDPEECALGGLPPGGVCDLSFVFHPTAPGLLTEDALVTDNALNATAAQQSITMTGNATGTALIPTATTVTVNPSATPFGTPITLTASVTAGGGSVSGSVVFWINGNEVGGGALTGAGTAVLALPDAPAGTDLVTATFAAQGAYGASDSSPAILVVAQATSQVTLSVAPQPIRLGQNATLTATVGSIAGGLPTGTVLFLNGAAQIGEASLNAAGQAIFSTTNLPAGTDSLTAQYLGDGNFQPSNSSPSIVTVGSNTLAITASPTLLTIPVAKTGQTTVTLTPAYNFSGIVNLSCAGLVQGLSCQFSSPSITFSPQSHAAQTVTLVIDPNTIASAGFGPAAGHGSLLLRLVLLFLALGSAQLLFVERSRCTLQGRGCTLLLLLCFGLLALVGCTNLAPRPSVSATITVQASTSSAGVIATAPLQIYIQQ